ncbi:hypothetical protein DFH27DRAFT_621639 [Peziza echinospora]|nr:hypothetical protein DFH27DRAFT_621639 [Peziza echinospora]
MGLGFETHMEELGLHHQMGESQLEELGLHHQMGESQLDPVEGEVIWVSGQRSLHLLLSINPHTLIHILALISSILSLFTQHFAPITTLIILAMSVREIAFFPPNNCTTNELRLRTSHFNLKKFLARVEGRDILIGHVYENLEANPAMYDDDTLKSYWVDPIKGQPVPWTPLQRGEKLSLKPIPAHLFSLQRTPAALSELSQRPTTGKRRKTTENMGTQVEDFTQSSQYTQASCAGSIDPGLDAVEDLRQDNMEIRSMLKLLQDDIAEVTGKDGKLNEMEEKMERLANNQLKDSESTQALTTRVISLEEDGKSRMDRIEESIGLAEKKTKETAAVVEGLQENGPTEELVRTVELLDSYSRARNVVVFGFKVNFDMTENPLERDLPGNDAAAFLDLIGLGPRDGIGNFLAVRRGMGILQGSKQLAAPQQNSQPRDQQDQAHSEDVEMNDTPTGEEMPMFQPPLVISFENSFRARDVIYKFLEWKRSPENAESEINARIDTTLRERQLQKETQQVVNTLREKGMDARYRPGGKIAIFKNGGTFDRYENWYERWFSETATEVWRLERRCIPDGLALRASVQTQSGLLELEWGLGS